MNAPGGLDIAAGMTIGGAVDLLLWASIILGAAILDEIEIACRRLGSAHAVTDAAETTDAIGGKSRGFTAGGPRAR